MKNENKCFFSISLENGITITGNNPVSVYKFIQDLYCAAVDCKETSRMQGYKDYSKKMNKYTEIFLTATRTIRNNYKQLTED